MLKRLKTIEEGLGGEAAMEQFMLQLGSMSFQAGIVICVVLLVRLLFVRMQVPKKYMCALWILPFLCMVCPWKFESEFGFWRMPERVEEMQQVQQTQELQEEVQYAWEAAAGETEQAVVEQTVPKPVQENSVAGATLESTLVSATLESTPVSAVSGRTMDYVAKADSSQMIYRMLWSVWLAGVLGLFLYSTASYLSLRRKLLCSICITDNIYIADDITVPFVLGVVKPRIYLPAGMPEESAEYVLAHERTHIRRMDPLKKILALCISSLHWFNPLSWAAFYFMGKDMEMACDEETVLQLGLERKKDYATALLTLSTGKRLFLGAPLAFDEGNVKDRVCNILRYKKTWRIVSALAIALILLLTICFMTEGADDGMSALGETSETLRLTQYQVDLTGDDIEELIVFEAENASDLTAEEILGQIWDGSREIKVKVIDGTSTDSASDDSEKDSDEVVLWETAYSGKDGANGNLAVCKATYKSSYHSCLLRYDNEVSDGKGRFWYELLSFESGKEPTVVAANEAVYDVVNTETLQGQEFSADYIAMVEQVLLVEKELEEYLRRAGVTGVLLNAMNEPQDCYLYQEDTNSRKSAFEHFALQAEGTGAEWKIEDFFYPKNPEGTTVLPADARERILSGEILCMDVTEENDMAGNLDLDGDGQQERIYLEAVDGYDGDNFDSTYRIRVENAYYEDYGDIVRPQVMTFSPDGETILLAIYDDGPSGDPLTTFFRYDAAEQQLYEAGYVTGDLLKLEIDEERIIICSYRADMIETQWIIGYWIWDGERIVLRDDEIYEFRMYGMRYSDTGEMWEDGHLVLKEPLIVYAKRDESSASTIMNPQKVYCTKTDLEEWIYLEAEDGTEGWLRVEPFGKIPSAGGKESWEVFEGLGFAG